MTSAQGQCHICKRAALITFCRLCDHWFCEYCRGQYWSRGLEAVKQLVGGRTEGCCGPTPTPTSSGDDHSDTDRP